MILKLIPSAFNQRVSLDSGRWGPAFDPVFSVTVRVLRSALTVSSLACVVCNNLEFKNVIFDFELFELGYFLSHVTFSGTEMLVKNSIYSRPIHNDPSGLFPRSHFQIKILIMMSHDFP